MKGLYLVTDRQLSKGRPVEEVVRSAVEGGVRIVQLREKDLPTRCFVEEAIQLKRFLFPLGIPLIINDRIDVALASAADGVHIGQEDMPYPLARKILGPDAIIGLTVETIEQVEEAEQYDVNYLGVSAIFTTFTKTDTKGLFGIEGLKKVRSLSRHILVAIGGINQSNAREVLHSGADSIAVVSAIMSADDPRSAAAELSSIIMGVQTGGET